MFRHLVPGRSLMTLALLMAVTLQGAPARSQSQDLPPVVLRGNPTVHQDRVALLREETRERRRELREARESLREARRGHAVRARGRKAEPRPGDEDRVPGAAPSRAAEPSGASGALVAPANVKTNDKTADGAGAGQAEQSVAFLGSNGICAWNDGQGFNLNPMDVQGIGYTVDGGATWVDAGIPLKQGTIATWSSDPVVTVNEKTGEFYYCGLTSNTGSNDNGVGVVRGHFAGGAFVQDAATVVASGNSGSQFYDKQWMCADSLTGNLYVTWTIFTLTGGDIWFSRSTNDGATWSAPIQISLPSETGLVSGSRPVVGPNGEVYVVYSAIGPVDVDYMRIARSSNQGTSFALANVASYYDNYFTGAPGFNRGRAVTFPAVAVDRSRGAHRGRIYVAWHEAVNFYGDGLGGGTAKSEVENNASYANATPFTINQTLRGAISTTSDTDHWKFPALQGTTYIFFVDSLRTTLFKYTMRIYCPNDTVAVSRLALSSDGTNGGTNTHALIVWTCPASGTYYLRMQFAASTGGYRIRTGAHTPVFSDRARDQRDCFVASSDDAVSWSTPARVNDDPGYLDDWLPEVAVPSDGCAYALWYDWRNTAASCYGGSDIYAARSADGGATWGAARRATTVTTANWTQVLSNIAPNEGDYNSIYGGDCLAMAWADGRLGDADVFAARVLDTFTASGPPTGAADAGTSFPLGDTVTNDDVLFPIDVHVTLAADRAWPGFPMDGGTISVPEGGSAPAAFSVAVPDSAADGTVNLCMTATLPNGALLSTWCTALQVTGSNSGVEPGAVALALHGMTPNPARGIASVSFSLPDGAPATLSVVDAAGRRIFEREVGGLGAGAHVVRLDRSFAPGVYLVRLTRGARTLTAKASVVR